MEFARALLRENLLQPRRRRVVVEVLHLDAARVVHLGLELPFAADLDGAQGDAEGLAAATDALDEFHKIPAKDAAADLGGECGVKFVSFQRNLPSY